MTTESDIKVKFSEHVFDCYRGRMSNIHGNRIDKETGRVDAPQLEKEILRKGVFYEDEKAKKPNSFYCVVNNLTVYRGRIDESGNLLITITYAFSKNHRGLFAKLPKLNIPAVQKWREDLETRIYGNQNDR